jgi:ubiquinone/menaquinone biosynthesis C-methylase UbiE
MPSNDTIIPDRQQAEDYDRQARETNWHGPEVTFGLSYEYIQPGDKVLDLGIGSGLSSVLFHKAGLQVYGLDGSAEVLEVCHSKGFAVELKQHDLRDLPLPYQDHMFDCVLCVAALNSFRDLQPLFAEVSRIMKPGGTFTFTVEEQKMGEAGQYLINRIAVAERPDETAVALYKHRDEDIVAWLNENGLQVNKALDFLAFRYPAEQKDIYFKAYVAQKK